MRYDREGDNHFDIASALMKSMRGSDPDAAVHYLARLLEAGDLITAIRRILDVYKRQVLFVAVERVPDAMIVAMERVVEKGLSNVFFVDGDAARCV